MITGKIQIPLECTDKGLGDAILQKTDVLQLGGKTLQLNGAKHLTTEQFRKETRTEQARYTSACVSHLLYPCLVALLLCHHVPTSQHKTCSNKARLEMKLHRHLKT